MSDSQSRPQPEKQEKLEKQEEKDEKERHEKSGGTGWRRDALSGVAWALILIWAGLVFLADTNGLLATLTRGLSLQERLGAWSFIFAGAGVIILAVALLRFLVPAYRRSIVGDVILGVIFLAIGLGDLVSWNIIWPIVIIGIGVILLLQGWIRPQR